MAGQDAIQPLGFVRVRTDITGDVGEINIPCAAGYNPILISYYGADKPQTDGVSTAAISVRTGANGTGTVLRSAFPLTGFTDGTAVATAVPGTAARNSKRTETLYVSCETASGVPGSSVKVAVYGYALP